MIWRRTLMAGLVFVVVACGAEDGTTATTALTVEEFEILEPVLLDDETVAAVLSGAEPAPEYSSNPPTSGARAGTWARCGIYRDPIPELYQVASLARGAVLVQYQSRLLADARANVEQVAIRVGDGVIVAPHDTLPSPIVVTAWGRMMRMSLVDSGRITSFVEQYGGRGPSPGTCPASVDER